MEDRGRDEWREEDEENSDREQVEEREEEENMKRYLVEKREARGGKKERRVE